MSDLLEKEATGLELENAHFECTENGVIFDEGINPSQNQIDKAIARLGRMTRISQFCLGDLINKSDELWGTKYDKWMELTGMSYQALANICQTARAIPLSLRREKLDFSAHMTIAQSGKAKDEEDKKQYLSWAADNNLTVRELRETIKRGQLTTNADIEREKQERNSKGSDGAFRGMGITAIELTRQLEEYEAERGMADTLKPDERAVMRQRFGSIYEVLKRLFGD